MLRHYLTAALAKFSRSPFTTAANVLTLALGLACFIAAYGIATYWTSADTHHRNADRTFVIGQSIADPESVSQGTPVVTSSAAIARPLAEDFPEVEAVARTYGDSGLSVVAGENRGLFSGLFVEPAFLDMFDFDFIAGDARTALDPPGSVVLSQDAARRLFGDAPAVGQSLIIAGDRAATVTGVIGPVRQPSFIGNGQDARLSFDIVGHWNVLPGGAARDEIELWAGANGMTFAMLAPGASVQAVNDRLADFVERRMPEGQRQSARVSLFAFPISEITTRDLDVTLFAGSDYGLSTIGVLIGFGALTLLVAAINYANLATAQAAAHRKDVGMRKALGAGRLQIMAQSWLETLTQTCAALVLALVILVLARPVVMSAWQVDALYFLTRDVAGFAVVGAIVLGVSLLAGAYPALVLSGVQPVRALQSGRAQGGPKFIARILVAVQFVAASFLLIMLTVGVEQRAFLERTALGVNEDPIVVLGDIIQVGVGYEALENALSGAPGVVSMTVDDRPPWTTGSTTFLVSPTPEEGAAELNVLAKHVGHDYFETLGLELQAGRTFQRDRETEPRTLGSADPSTPMPIVIDRALADALGFSTPEAAVDQVVYLPVRFMRFVGRSVAQPVQILGVVDQDMMRVEARGNSGYIYVFGPNSPANNALYPVIRLDRQNLTVGLASVERAWNEPSPTTAISINFFDELFEQAYSEYARVSQLFILLAGTAFIIASIGQLGIAVHVVSRRRHEIGVRKVLGSTSLGVVRLLLIDFSKPALVANLLAWPLGYLAAQTYLSAFAHRIELTPAPFLISMAITLGIAWAAVIGEVLKAASVRPAEVLRHA